MTFGLAVVKPDLRAYVGEKIDRHFSWKAAKLKRYYTDLAAEAMNQGLTLLAAASIVSAAHWQTMCDRNGTDTASLNWLTKFNAAQTIPVTDVEPEVTGFEVVDPL